MRRRKQWSELTRPQRMALVLTAAVEIALTSVALADLARRPPDQVRGPKRWWALGCFVQPVGPVAYLALGRR